MTEPRARYPPPDDDWWRSEMGKQTCRGCGEDRLTHSIVDGWGEQVYCQVCSRSWVVKTHSTWQTRAQAGKTIKVGTTGE